MANSAQWYRVVKSIAAEFGGTVDVTTGGHLRIRLPNNAVTFAASTPRNQWRETKNVRTQLRKAAAQPANQVRTP